MNGQFYDIEIAFKGFDDSQTQYFKHVSKIVEQDNQTPITPDKLVLKRSTGYAIYHAWYSQNDANKFDERITTFNSDSVVFITIKPEQKLT